METLNVGIVGAGMIARFHAMALQALEGVKLTAVCDSGSGSAKTLADEFGCEAFSGYESMLEQPLDMVTITTPSGLHLEPTLLAAQRGIHVLCEKPLEISTERVDQMLAAHATAGTHLGGIFNYRYDEAVTVIKHAVDAGRLGRLTYAAVHVPWYRPQSYYDGTWKGTLQLDGGGAIMNQSIHMVDLLQLLAGPVRSLKAYKATLGHQMEAEDVANAVVQFENGALGHIYGTTASFPGRFRQIELTGTEGTIAMVENSLVSWQFAEDRPEDEQIRQRYGTATGGGGVADPAAIDFENHRLNMEGFVEAIRSGHPFAIDGREARKAVAIVEALYRSAETNQEVLLS